MDKKTILSTMRSHPRRAQAVLEVAIFGAVIIFLIGFIVQQGAAASFSQHYNLRTMREVMHLSSLCNIRANNDAGCISRAVSLLVVEDRLTPGVLKYGSIDRAPIVISSGATFTKDLFYPADPNYNEQLPVMTLRINGCTFEFTTAAWKSGFSGPCYQMAPKDPGSKPSYYWKPITDWETTVGNGGTESCATSPGGTEMTVYTTPANRGYYLDPTAGEVNGNDPDQGMRTDVKIVTDIDASMNVTKGVASSPSKTQVDSICRKFVGNDGTWWLCTKIRRDNANTVVGCAKTRSPG